MTDTLSKAGALPANVAATPALVAHELQKHYRQRRQTIAAVQTVSLTMQPGEVLAFLGPNGAGKTTTIKMIAGLIRPDAGWVRVNDRDPHSDRRSLAEIGAVLEGNRNLYWRLTPQENLEYFGVLRGLSTQTARRRSRDLIEQFDLVHKRRTPVQALSRGMQQKLAIAVALVHQPRLLLLDEPTLGLDVEASQHVKVLVRSIAQDGCAILLTTHQLNVAEELSDRVAIIQQGQIIAEATTRDLIRQFSGSSYAIEFEGELDSKRQRAIEAIGAFVHPHEIHYTGSSEGLYAVLDLLKPLPLLQVKKDQADLTEIFLKLVKGDRG
ncbi:ABC transporter ATP-binding protein [Microcoleus sp. FACHB-1515]|uniref:ABC transporter ATP-binding protein n=1 Tax=Cyanophyceae TaxID=3028117 RepID=UPI001686D74D|nr:ABC transporter ATP-binding protein [Microcoleus sp. FACHB-1515]MBD2088981.1 ABC transporter ATP-binding protein [Microcoleus sp. FACHB-1515]